MNKAPANLASLIASVAEPLVQAAQPVLRSLPQPPAWLVHELQQRAVLWMNHLLGAEPQARERLLPHAGKVARVQVGPVTLNLQVTRAGMLELASAEAGRHLNLEVMEKSPLALAQLALQGQKPDLRIEGDVQLAAEMAWLMENLRWDYEEDLSRIVGDAPAAALGQGIRKVGAQLQSWMRKAPAQEVANP